MKMYHEMSYHDIGTADQAALKFTTYSGYCHVNMRAVTKRN